MKTEETEWKGKCNVLFGKWSKRVSSTHKDVCCDQKREKQG